MKIKIYFSYYLFSERHLQHLKNCDLVLLRKTPCDLSHQNIYYSNFRRLNVLSALNEQYIPNFNLIDEDLKPHTYEFNFDPKLTIEQVLKSSNFIEKLNQTGYLQKGTLCSLPDFKPLSIDLSLEKLGLEEDDILCYSYREHPNLAKIKESRLFARLHRE